MVHLIWVAWAIKQVRNTKYEIRIPFVKADGIFLYGCNGSEKKFSNTILDTKS